MGNDIWLIMKVVLASKNAGKIRELKELLKNFPIEIVLQSDLCVEEIKETGSTFIENALIKARHASHMTGLPAIADDSGLTVSILNGAPGIYSARYAGARATAKDNINKLLSALKEVPDEKRSAAFHCILVYLSHDKDPIPLVCDGIWHGMILHEPKGEDGFGYDPVFYVPAEKKTAAELPLALKNKISHRGIALQSLIKKLPEKL